MSRIVLTEEYPAQVAVAFGFAPAAIQRLTAVWRLPIDQPAKLRSWTPARNSFPSTHLNSVISPIHRRSEDSAVKSRSNRSGAGTV